MLKSSNLNSPTFTWFVSAPEILLIVRNFLENSFIGDRAFSSLSKTD